MAEKLNTARSSSPGKQQGGVVVPLAVARAKARGHRSAPPASPLQLSFEFAPPSVDTIELHSKWHTARTTGSSRYLARRQVQPEACRFLEDGSVAYALTRDDYPPEHALRALGMITPDGRLLREGHDLHGATLWLGAHGPDVPLAFVCEDLVSGLSIRQALQRTWPVIVTHERANYAWAFERTLRRLPRTHLILCAATDSGASSSRELARMLCESTRGCSYLYPAFDMYPAFDSTRPAAPAVTFNDVHVQRGIATVRSQLATVLNLIGYGGFRGRR